MKGLILALVAAASLAGCATQWVVDSDVRTFSGIDTVPAGSTYRFERLPSQQAREDSQLELEAMAGVALDGVGLRRDDAAPRYSAQINAHVTAELSPWADPWFYGGPWGPGYGYGRRWGYGYGVGYGRWYGGGWYGSAFPPANPWYVREVSILLRELPSNRIVYETHARNDGPYTVSAAVLPVMFRAALDGFPNPRKGERRVDLAIPTAKN